MESAAQEKRTSEVFLLKSAGKLSRFDSREAVPALAEGDVLYDRDALENSSKEMIEELYSKVVGADKKFKTLRVAIDSLVYQVSKIPTPGAKSAASAKIGTALTNSGSGDGRTRKEKGPETFELLAPADLENVLKGLPPQCRELAAIMAELGQEVKSESFPASALEAKLKVPEVAARLRTKQDPLRILAYYRSRLEAVGLLKITSAK